MEDLQTNSKYKEKSYWDDRYTREDSYEWFADYEKLSSILRRDITTQDKILMLGCGNSRLSEDMYHDGYKNIVNIDYSSVVIQNMQEKCSLCPLMSWRIMDINHLDFDPQEFDVVLEKGTLDALLVGQKDPWRYEESTITTMHNIMSQISRILKPKGKFISITFSQPHFRIPLYAREEYDWSIDTRVFGTTFHYFCYVMERGQCLSEEDKAKAKAEELRRKQTNVVLLQTCRQLEEDENFLHRITT